MRKSLSVLVLALLVTPPVVARAADTKVGYVNLQRALEEVEEGKSAKNRLKKQFEASQKKLDAELETLKLKKEELDKKRLAMDEATLRQKAEELDKEMVRVHGVYSKLQKELSEAERKELAGIDQKMQKVIQTIAEKEGFTVVLDARTLVWASPALDITNELIRAYNAQSGKK